MKFLLEHDQLKNHFSDEWLETNSIGGYASSTISGAHSRKYHGILVAPVGESAGRHVLLSRFDETVVIGENAAELATRKYRDTTKPKGQKLLSSFEQRYSPVFTYAETFGEQRFCLEKSILALHNENTVLIRYHLKEASEPVTVHFEPFVAARFFHSLRSATKSAVDRVDWANGQLHVSMPGDLPLLSILSGQSTFHDEPHWYYNFFYNEEQQRGHEAEEDLYRVGVISHQMQEGEEHFVVITVESERRQQEQDPSAAFAAELKRREGIAGRDQENLNMRSRLLLAADRHLINRSSPQQDRATVIAGYPWFADWGRDSMISFAGLCLVPERFDEAKQILKSHAEAISEGMIPNRFPDCGSEPEYNSVDASLWFFIAVYQYALATGDYPFVRDELYERLLHIEQHFRAGTRFGIQADDDELLMAGSGTDQLTWMDARVGDWVVTPRHGKAVEVNALWFNALCILCELSRDIGEDDLQLEFEKRAGKVKKAFRQVFWNEEKGYLADVVDSQGVQDISLRPNQIFALSLAFPLVSEQKGRKVLKKIQKKLLTPVGLRTLSPNHSDYHGKYEGSITNRDGAYHQGTVWPWLLGAYADAVNRYGTKEMKAEISEILGGFGEQLGVHGIGSISEIYDGDPPHTPRGCISQAWSVAEILRVLKVSTQK